MPLDAPPLPRVLEPAASIVAQFSAADHNPNSDPNPNHAGVPEDLLRLSTGCEDWRDLLADLTRALDQA